MLYIFSNLMMRFNLKYTHVIIFYLINHQNHKYRFEIAYYDFTLIHHLVKSCCPMVSSVGLLLLHSEVAIFGL